MLRNITELVVKINDREYRFTAAQDSPIVDCKEANFQFMKWFGQIEDNAKTQVVASESNKPIEDVSVEQS